MSERARFAPSPTGPAHPGTLLSALLCWLDARSRGAEIELRFEDVDTTRCREEWVDEMCAALRWLGLDWDRESRQSHDTVRHLAALEALWAGGKTYACRCSRAEIRAAAEPAADGGWRYPGTCRDAAVPEDEPSTVRFKLDPGVIRVVDEGGECLDQDAFLEMGDPVLRRKDGDVAYHLAVVVDDAHSNITRVVRGRDLAQSTAIHIALQRALGYASPTYRHHFLLVEERGAKLAKLHGAVGWRELAECYSPEAFCGWLAAVAGVAPDAEPIRPVDLVPAFHWPDVRREDAVVRWTGERLERVYSAAATTT